MIRSDPDIYRSIENANRIGVITSQIPQVPNVGKLGECFLVLACGHMFLSRFHSSILPRRFWKMFQTDAYKVSPLSWFGSCFAHGGILHLGFNAFAASSFSARKLELQVVPYYFLKYLI